MLLSAWRQRRHAGAIDPFDERLLERLTYLSIVARRVIRGRWRAEHRSQRVGAGIEFADHRPYAPGDDVRYIDWTALGRTDRLLLRLFEQDEDLPVYLLLDVSQSMLQGSPNKLRYGMHLVAALAYLGLSSLDRVGVTTFSDRLIDRLPAARGRARIFKVFELLQRTASGGVTDLDGAARLFVRENRRRGVVAVVSDFYDSAGGSAALDILRHNRFEPFALQLYDHAEAHPTITGDVALIDCESGAIREVTLSPGLLEQYARAHEGFCRRLEAFCAAKQVPFVRADTRVPFDEIVLTVLRRRGFLR